MPRVCRGKHHHPMIGSHISTDDLERYHLGHVQEPELARIEEHLLWCQDCLDRMEATARLIGLIRAGAILAGFDKEYA